MPPLQLTPLELERWVPVEHLQGDAHLVRHDFTHTVDGEEVPRDMSAYSFAAQIRPRPGSGRILAQLEVDDSNASEGVIVFELVAADSAGLRAGSYRWDAQWTYSGRPFTFALGTWIAAGQVTR